MSGADLLTIVQCGDPVLRQRAEPVDPSTLASAGLRRLIVRMRATMEAAPGVGLAAPQVGESIQVAVLQDSPERWTQSTPDELAARDRHALPFTVFVNPVLTAVAEGGSVSFYEGCLSVPGLTGVVSRHRAVQVDALDEHGEPFSRLFTGWSARIAQHEIDHLGGRLYLDRVETRSISTTENYGQRWAGRPPSEAAAALGFTIAE